MTPVHSGLAGSLLETDPDMYKYLCAMFLCAVPLLAGGAGVSNEARRSWEASVYVRVLNVRSGPGEEHPIVGKLKRGSKVRAFDEDGRWVHVRDFDGSDRTGWVHRFFVRLPKDFMAPTFGDAENAFLEWVSHRGDLSEVSVEADDQVSIVLEYGVDAYLVHTIAREVACAWRDLFDPKFDVTVTVWSSARRSDSWLGQARCS